MSGPPAQNIVIPQLDSSLSDVEGQDDPDLNMLDSDYNQDLSSPLGLNTINEASVPAQEVSPSQDEETVYAEVTVPDLETLENSAPEVSLTDEDINHLDDFFEEIGAVGTNIIVQESSDSPSDQEPEEYVRQFTPEHVPEQPNLENVVQDDDSQLIDYLRTFTYVQHSQPKRNDIIYYYDSNVEDFVKVRIISKSNYRYYYNVRFLELDRPDGGVCLEPNGYWSHTLPVPANVEGIDQVQEDEVLPPIEEERRGRCTSLQRQVSPMIYQHGISSVRPDRVYRLPEDQFRDQLSPKSRRKADNLSLAPQQEYMRSAIGRSLASSRSSDPASKMLNAVKRVLGKKQ